MGLYIVGVVIAVVAVAIVALRWRKVRRDALRGDLGGHEPGSPPPSPYSSRRGFRLLETDGPSPEPAPPPRPRLEDHDYVFADAQLLPPADPSTLAHRHDVSWALERAGHRSPLAGRRLRRTLIAGIIVLALVVAGTVIYRHHRSWFGARAHGAPVVVIWAQGAP